MCTYMPNYPAIINQIEKDEDPEFAFGPNEYNENEVDWIEKYAIFAHLFDLYDLNLSSILKSTYQSNEHAINEFNE